MIKRRAIGPDQIQEGNKIECHVAGACATYLDSNLQWQISDNTVLQHFDSPTDATTGREIWTNRPLTVGVNSYGARQDLVTIRESSSLGKHTEWTITPIDSHSLRRKVQENTTEYDLDEQVIQATSNNTTRIFTPYIGQPRISYEIVAPKGGEIREENGQINAYRDNFYLFTIAEPTVYDVDKQLIVDAEGLPVRCYSIRLEIVSTEDGHYIVHKEKCADVPEDCAWVDVEIFVCQYSFLTSRIVYEAWDAAQAAQTSTNSYFVVDNITPGDINNKPRIVCGRYNSTQHQIDRSYLNFNSSALVGTVINVDLKLYANALSGSGNKSAPRIIVQNANIDPVNDNTTTICKTRHRAYATPVYSDPISVVVGDFITVPLLPSCINNNTLATGYTSLALREYDHDYNNSQPSDATSYGCSFYFSPDESQTAVLSITIDSGHTGAFKPAEIVGSIPSEGGVVQIDFTGSNAVGLDIANNLSDTSGATDIHFRTVDASGDPDELIPFQRLSASGSGSTFAYSAKLDMPAGVTDFTVCYGPNNPPDPDYVDFSSSVSGTPINTGKEEPGEGFWSFFYSVTVNVTTSSPGGPLSGATVTFDGTSQTTGAGGSVTFTDIASDTYDLSVSAVGYATYECTVTVTDADVTQNIELTPSSATITFSLTDALLLRPLEGVSVVFCSAPEQFTSSAGQAVFPGVALGNDRPYTLSKSGFVTQTGTIDVTADATFSFVLQYAIPDPLPDPRIAEAVDPRTAPIDITGVSQYLAEQYRS